MDRKKSYRAAILVIAVLSIAASSPGKTVRVLHTPERIGNRFDEAIGKQISLHKWSKLQKMAEQGDPEAMYRVGHEMRRPWMSHLTGVPSNDELGEELIRQSAESGFPMAVLAVWKMEGENPSELTEVAHKVRSGDFEVRAMHELSGWLHWYGMQTCDEQLAATSNDLTEDLLDYYGETRSSLEAMEQDYKDRFQRECSSEGLEISAKQADV